MDINSGTNNKEMANDTKLGLASFARFKYDKNRKQSFLILPERVVQLNETAALILEHCQSPISVDELVRQVIQVSINPGVKKTNNSDEANVDTIRSDIKEFLNDVVSRGWIQIV